ncbi:hypothetical protein ACROYT_G009369 [Oculina patagonica]
MDCGICSGCRSLTRLSTIFTFLVVTLLMLSVKVSSVKLSEQKCQPRPVVVQETEGNKPFHILLHRCSGTCDESIPPSQKPCTASKREAISLEVKDPLSGEPKTITVYNHTSCHCTCNLECQWDQGEVPDEENCRCKSGPDTGKQHGENEKVDVLPYKIGIALMGFVTLIVVVFELIMCAKRKQVVEKVKESCCKKEGHIDGKERKSNNSLNTAV